MIQLDEIIPVHTPLTLNRVNELLSYDPVTGVWAWRVKHGNRHAGDAVRSKQNGGYVQITIDRKNYTGHRLAWFYMTGEWPGLKIDHVNSIRDDNRWINLRLATNSQNGANATMKSTNSTGFKGVSIARNGKYRAQISKDRKAYALGIFGTAEEASDAYLRAAKKMHGEFAKAA